MMKLSTAISGVLEPPPRCTCVPDAGHVAPLGSYGACRIWRCRSGGFEQLCPV
jgi:hypothetical protein